MARSSALGWKVSRCVVQTNSPPTVMRSDRYRSILVASKVCCLPLSLIFCPLTITAP